MAPIFGIAGASLSLLGCILGNLFTIYYFIAQQEQQSFLSVLTANLSAAPTLMASAAQPMDLLFYGLALYYGYKLSFHPRA
jgi:ABC-type lipoprotein release transport system permease subunit